MLLDIKSRINDKEIRELLESCILPTPEKVEKAISDYTTRNDLSMYGYEQNTEIVGIIGFEMTEKNDLVIRHIAVKPEYRGLGFGRGQILEVINELKPTRVIAETDDDAVDFYRWIGFEVESLGERYPGVRRYRCTYNTII